MDSLLTSSVEEICSHLHNGLSLPSLWSRLSSSSSSSSNLDLSPSLKQSLWDALRSIPTLNILSPAQNYHYAPADSSIHSFQAAENLNLKLVADESLRNNFMGLYNVDSANNNLSAVQRHTLERVVMARENGITQTQIAKELGIEGRNFHYAVKNLECQGLLVRQSALLRTKEAGDDRNNPSVTTNMLYLNRHAKHLTAQQKIEIVKEERNNESSVSVRERSAGGDGFGGNVHVKDFLPAMKAVCDKLEEANGKVLVVADVKKELGYCRSSGHRAWRNICQRLKAAHLVEVFDANVNGKVESCLRFVENSSPIRVEPRTVVHVDDDFVEEKHVKFGKRCKITDQLVELPIEHQIYELIDAAGSEGLTRNEVMERLGIDNKKNYARFVTMCSRFEMNLQPEMHKKAVAYRFRTSGKHRSESNNAFIKKSTDANDGRLSSQCDGSVDTPMSDLSLKGDYAGPENINNRETNSGPFGGSIGPNESYNVSETSQQLCLGSKDAISDSQVSLISTGVETNGALLGTPAASSKLHSKGSDPRYPCMSLTVDNTRREKRIVERLEGEKFILRAELYRWLVSLETDKCTATDRKTIDRILQKLQQLGHCKCIDISVPVVTNLGRSRTTVVILHPSVQSLTPELVSEIHDAWRSFEVQSRGKCSSRWREKNIGSVPVLEDVQRTQTHVSAHQQTVSSEAMRANGFILAKMVRAKLLHSFLWEYLYGSSSSYDALSSAKDVSEPRDPHNTSKLFSLEATMKAIPVELFLQVAGSTKNFEEMIDKCKKGLCLSDLSAEEYKSLMDTHATGRLSLVIDILRRLKLIRMVCDHRSEDGLEVLPPIISAYALELKPYVEEPVSKDAISLSFGSLDLRPRIRHDFSLSNREAVDEYWQTLEYCYAAADPRAALLAFPGSCVHEVSNHRSWTKLGVMTAAQRDELLKRVVKDDPSEKLSFKECGKIAKDLNLTLEQVLRVYYNKRRQHLDGLQNNTDELQSEKRRRRKRKKSSESRSVDFSKTDEVIRQMEEQTRTTVSNTIEQLEELNFLVASHEHDSHVQALDNCLETGQEPEPNEDNEGCHSITTKGSFSKLKPIRPRKRKNLHSTRQRRFSWTEEADRQLIIQYVRHRASLGANIHRVNWALIPDLPAAPVACMKRMASLKSNKKFRSAVMRLCNILSERYAKVLKKTQNRSLEKNECSVPLRNSTGERHDSNLPNINDHNLGTALQDEPWDDFNDNYVKKSLEEVLHHKRLAKFDASKRVGSTGEDWSVEHESELIASTAPSEDFQNHAGRGKISARRSRYQHLNEKYFKLLHGVDVSTQVYKSLAVSNAVELFKLVFLSTSTAPEVPNLLASILRRYSECDLFAAFNYLKDKKFMVGGNGSQKFSLSQQFLHSTSASPFPTNCGKRATKFAHWLHEKDKDLMGGGVNLSTDLQCGDILHLFALVSTGELSIFPYLPDEGVGEAEESRSSKRKADINELLDDEKTKKLKSFAAAEGEIISRREKGFPGITVSVSRAEFSVSNSIDLFRVDAPNDDKHFEGNHQLESTSDRDSLSHSDCMNEVINSSSTVPVLEIACESPWEGMVGYAEHLFSLRPAEDQSSPIQPEILRAAYIAIQKAGDQGLSIEEVSEITNIQGGKMNDLIIDVLQTFERVLRVDAYDSIRVVDSLYRGKYFMTSVSGVSRKLEPPSWRKPIGEDDGHIHIHSENRDNDAAPSEREINSDIHKLTILNFPEDVDVPSYVKQTESYRERKGGDAGDESSRSSNDRLCMPIFPWINGDGSTNKIVYKGLRRRVLGIVMQNPAILEDEIIRRMDVLNPQSCRKLLELMVLDNHLHVRKMHQTTCAGPPPILGTLLGSSYKPSKLVCREHYFANPTSTSLL
ncbi:uncharacterized protein LOC126798301 isoform X2 [Argentina anserina]|uniref:uncharacterized protein LOC126798301 isoform X2 n=1 Tax=Argentina anserina TaxID=57926 RepID=UPI002176637A|nr:uncharacterized protein LOC126798301 isoform X2 [Potentilla anserina]